MGVFQQYKWWHYPWSGKIQWHYPWSMNDKFRSAPVTAWPFNFKYKSRHLQTAWQLPWWNVDHIFNSPKKTHYLAVSAIHAVSIISTFRNIGCVIMGLKCTLVPLHPAHVALVPCVWHPPEMPSPIIGQDALSCQSRPPTMVVLMEQGDKLYSPKWALSWRNCIRTQDIISKASFLSMAEQDLSQWETMLHLQHLCSLA